MVRSPTMKGESRIKIFVINEHTKVRETQKYRKQTDSCQMRGGWGKLGGKGGGVKKFKLVATEQS